MAFGLGGGGGGCCCLGACFAKRRISWAAGILSLLRLPAIPVCHGLRSSGLARCMCLCVLCLVRSMLLQAMGGGMNHLSDSKGEGVVVSCGAVEFADKY